MIESSKFKQSALQEKQTPSAQPVAERPTAEEISQKREMVLQSLENARLLPPEWKSKTGKSRAEMITALEESLEELDVLMRSIQDEPEPVAKKKPVGHTLQYVVQSREATDAAKYEPEAGKYITIGKVHIPVCQTPKKSAEWNAIPGDVFVSGGKKFSKVKFAKHVGGSITHVAKPGELMNFSERHRGELLPSIDAILEGRDEFKAFKEILYNLGELTRQYNELNPDDADYNERAKQLGIQIEAFTDPERLKEILELNRSRIDDMDDFAERVSYIIRTQQFLRSIDESLNEFIPPRDIHFKLTPYFEQKLEWFATLVNRQLGIGNNAYLEDLVENNKAPEWEKLTAKGITTIVGPRGAGKNKLIDYYCSETNRPLFRYVCSPDKEERDLTYDVELSDGEVVRIPTRILTAITTPNAVLELDEINLLRPNVAKFFNSLFDGDRSIFLNDQVIKVAPGVIFVGLMNPAGYDGVEDLPETIDDRSNVMTMGYPPFRLYDSTTNRQKITYDEALILKENVSLLKNLDDEQFRKAWDYVINGVGAQISLDATTVKIIKDLKNIVAISDRTRQVVEAYKKRIGDTRMERDVSIRGSIEAFRFYSENHLWEADRSKMPNWKANWNPAQYAIAMTYLPHTETYRRGETDRQAMELVLAETIR